MSSSLLDDTIYDTDGLADALQACFAFFLFVYLLNLITDEYSWVDRFWSITPVIYSWIYTAAVSRSDNRSSPFQSLNVFISLLITTWGLRLSYNFCRKGGYHYDRSNASTEDYRWKFVRGIISEHDCNSILWQLFNLLFICLYQNFLLWVIVLPQWYRNHIDGKAGNYDSIRDGDYISAFLFVVGLLLETIADEQQWRFQCEKSKYKAQHGAKDSSNNNDDVDQYHPYHSTKSDLENGFLTHGLFAYSRHPNFVGEQIIWIAIWSFSWWVLPVGDTMPSNEWMSVFSRICNPSSIGALLLLLLFQGSTRLTEQISVDRYGKAYVAYQQRVGMLLPNILGMLRRFIDRRRGSSGTLEHGNQESIVDKKKGNYRVLKYGSIE